MAGLAQSNGRLPILRSEATSIDMPSDDFFDSCRKIFKLFEENEKRRTDNMQAYKCDRCGELFERPCYYNIRINVDCHPYEDNYLDLCDKCQFELEKWIDDGGNKNVATERYNVFKKE